MSTLKTVNIIHPSGTTNNIVNDSSGNVLIGTSTQVGLGGQLQISGANAVGGAGYNTFLTVQNSTSGATNPKKYFRLNSTGGLEVINDGYTAAILVVDNSGILSFNSGFGSAAPAYACRAWCTYNGVTSSIVASANISSVTKNSTGYYTFNFSNAMPDANYSTQANVQKDDGSNDANAYAQAGGYATAKQTAALTYVITRRTSGLGAFDSPATFMAVFR